VACLCTESVVDSYVSLSMWCPYNTGILQYRLDQRPITVSLNRYHTTADCAEVALEKALDFVGFISDFVNVF